MARRVNLKCPTCDAGLTQVIYGMPVLETFEAADRGEIKLGGCEIWFDNPDFECRGAGHHLWQRNPSGGLVPITS